MMATMSRMRSGLLALALAMPLTLSGCTATGAGSTPVALDALTTPSAIPTATVTAAAPGPSNTTQAGQAGNACPDAPAPTRIPIIPDRSLAAASPGLTTSGLLPTGELRRSLAGVMADRKIALADLATDPATSFTEQTLSSAPGWRLISMTAQVNRRQLTVRVAIDDNGALTELTGSPNAFQAVSSKANVRSAADAAGLAAAYLDQTAPPGYGTYRVSRDNDIVWQYPRLNAARIDKVRLDIEGRLSSPSAVLQDDGSWQVTLWTVTKSSLEQHVVSIAPDGAMTDNPTTIIAQMPSGPRLPLAYCLVS